MARLPTPDELLIAGEIMHREALESLRQKTVLEMTDEEFQDYQDRRIAEIGRKLKKR